MDIQNVINVSVSVLSPGISQIGFGEPCVFFYGEPTIPTTNPITNSERVRRYSSSTALSDMAADGFNTTDPVYLAVQAIVRQNPHPPTVKVARGSTDFTWDMELLPKTFVVDEVYTWTITKGAVTASYTRTSLGVSLAAEAIAMALLMNNDAAGFGSGGSAELLIVANGNNIELDTVSPANDGEVWYLSGMSNLTVTDVTPERDGVTSMADELNTVVAANADWYALVLADSFGATEIAAAATWVEGQTNKILCASTQDSNVVDAGTGIGATLSTADDDQTHIIYSHHSMSEYPGGASGGRFLPEKPGTEMWAFKTLSGVTPSNLTAAQIANAEAEFVNVYTGLESGGVEIVAGNLWKGWSSGSAETFIDTIRLIDATVAEVQTRVLSLLRAQPKLPYTNQGLASVKGALLAAVRNFMPLGYVEGSQFVDMPNVDDISTANKQARILPSVTFGAVLAGGIARVNITGQLSF